MRPFTFPEDKLPKMWEISEIFHHYFTSLWYTNWAVPHQQKMFWGSSQEKLSQEIFESALCQHLAFSQISGIFPNTWEIFFIPLLVQKGCSPPPEDILGKQSKSRAKKYLKALCATAVKKHVVTLCFFFLLES